MAIQEVHNTTHQANSPGRQTLDRVMNNIGQFVGNFLIQSLGNNDYMCVGYTGICCAKRSISLILWTGWNFKTNFLCTAYGMRTNSLTFVLHFWASTGYVRA